MRSWLGRKIHLYNVTMGLYMLDWWERYVFNILMIVLLWFIFYNGSRSATEFYNRYAFSITLSISLGILVLIDFAHMSCLSLALFPPYCYLKSKIYTNLGNVPS